MQKQQQQQQRQQYNKQQQQGKHSLQPPDEPLPLLDPLPRKEQRRQARSRNGRRRHQEAVEGQEQLQQLPAHPVAHTQHGHKLSVPQPQDEVLLVEEQDIVKARLDNPLKRRR